MLWLHGFFASGDFWKRIAANEKIIVFLLLICYNFHTTVYCSKAVAA